MVFMDQIDVSIKGLGLENIQELIDSAFVSCYKNSQTENLQVIKYKLIEMANANPMPVIIYWLVYSMQHLAILYGINKESDKEGKEITESVNLLEGIEEKNSEDYALLALMGGYSAKYTSVFRIAKLIDKCKGYANTALELDSNNLRAHLALGIFDFNTLETFGGGKVLEENLNYAISLDCKSSCYSPYGPKWGKNMAYCYLIRYYLRKENNAQANFYFDEAISLFPTDRILMELKKELKK